MINIIKNRTEKAFTLVEMAIVVTIIGLLMGGIMTAMKMVKNAKIAATVMQINNYTAAMKTFEKTYGGLPGDLLDADKKIKGCKAVGGLSGCQYTGSVTANVCNNGNPIDGCTSALDTFCANSIATNLAIDNGVCNALTPIPIPWGYGGNRTTCMLDQALNNPYANYNVCKIVEQSNYFTPVTQTLTVSSDRGDGIIGDPAWDMATFRGKTLLSSADSNTTGAETLLFWYELKQAGLISGVTDAALRGSKPSFGKTHPAAELGGGFWVGNSDGKHGGIVNAGAYAFLYTGRPTIIGGLGDYTILGTVLALVKITKGSSQSFQDTNTGYYYNTLSLTQNKNILTPNMAANIDRKLDDGKPDTGTVQAFGKTTSCYGLTPPFSYNEAISSKDCGIYALIHQ